MSTFRIRTANTPMRSALASAPDGESRAIEATTFGFGHLRRQVLAAERRGEEQVENSRNISSETPASRAWERARPCSLMRSCDELPVVGHDIGSRETRCGTHD